MSATKQTVRPIVWALMGLGAAAFAAGLVLGPGYYMYCTLFSGAQVGKYLMSENWPKSWRVAGGGTLAFEGHRVFKPVMLELEPAMNPVVFNYAATSSGSSVTRALTSNQYRLELIQGAQRAMQAGFSVSRADKDKAWGQEHARIVMFDVPRAGKYQMVVGEVLPPQFSVSLEIEVRRNVTPPNMTLVFSAVGGGIAGLVLAVVVLIANSEPPGRRPRSGGGR